MLINEQGAIVEYVAQNPNNGQTVIKSVYKKPNKEIGELNIKGILDGRTHSSPAPSYQDINNHIQTTRPAAARFSALQDTMHNHITPINNAVNNIEQRQRRFGRVIAAIDAVARQMVMKKMWDEKKKSNIKLKIVV